MKKKKKSQLSQAITFYAEKKLKLSVFLRSSDRDCVT